MTPRWAALVPELSVTDLERSLRFYETFGFTIRYRRAAPPFACIELGEALIMLEQIHSAAWVTGPLEAPLGRGINFEIQVDDARSAAATAAETGIPLFGDLDEAWYEVGEMEQGQRQFLVQDPDGYLLRFAQSLGQRPARR